MDIFTNHLFEWILLVAGILAAFYTLKIIGEEKSTFREEAYQVRFGELSLMIPRWWTITEESPTRLKFERTDTRYDWHALYQYLPSHENKSLPKLLEEKLNREKIEFDMDVVFETDSRVLFRDDQVQKLFQEVIRVEGQASQDVEDRIYYDIYIMRAENSEGYFIFESRSSILNGAIEGPYFEESLSELGLVTEA